jgi:hypothetical protein
VVGITFAFGSRFTELETGFFAPLVVLYALVLIAWSTGHLSNNMSIEVWLKLLAWFAFIVLLPFFLLRCLVIMTEPSVVLSYVLVWAFFILGNLAYWACFRFLKQSIIDLRFQRFLKFITIAISTVWGVWILILGLGIFG